MTYIEFFDKTAVENICACLTDVPERVIFIGDNSKIMKKHITNYESIFAARGEKVEFLFKTVSKSNLDNAVKLLTEIVNTYEDCVFDITGGEEILLLALGIVYQQYPERNIQIHRFNVKNNAVYDCDKDGNTIYKEVPTLTVKENIKLYGGDVAYSDINGEKTYLWDLTSDFKDDIETMWSICRKDVRFWNTQIGVLEAAERLGSLSSDGLTTEANVPHLKTYLQKHCGKFIFTWIVDSLCKKGLITAYYCDDARLSITYKNPQVKRCLTKAGQALEMKIFLTAKAVTDETGKPVYDDVQNGVVIDWDGEMHGEVGDNQHDTENEIDVLLMHDIVPVFISCKNGYVSVEELYKLNTVAERFGGKYAKKVLVATSLSAGNASAANSFRQRADDMGIKVIENIQTMTDAELEKKLKNLWCN